MGDSVGPSQRVQGASGAPPVSDVGPLPSSSTTPRPTASRPCCSELGASLLVSTYQANKLLVARAAGAGLSMLVRTFDRPMGLAVDGRRLAIGTRNRIWFLRNAPDIAPRVEPAGQHDACYPAALLPRHRRHRRPRDGLGGRRAVGRQHPLLLPVYAAPRLQLRAALAAAVHHRPGRRGPLPSERPGHRRRPPASTSPPWARPTRPAAGGRTSPTAAA